MLQAGHIHNTLLAIEEPGSRPSVSQSQAMRLGQRGEPRGVRRIPGAVSVPAPIGATRNPYPRARYGAGGVRIRQVRGPGLAQNLGQPQSTELLHPPVDKYLD